MESAKAKAFFESCPECAGAVHRVARKCKHCGADLQPEPTPAPVPAPAPVPRSPSPSPAPTPTSRRWMLAGAAVLILAVGLALGILLERGSHPDRSRAAPPRTPNLLRNFDDPDPDPDPAPGITFNWSFRSQPQSRRRATPTGSPNVDEFVSRLGDELCEKITDCGGADPAVGLLCRTIAANIQTDDVADKIKSGECEYDPAAAAACIQGLENLDCGTRGSATVPLADPFALMMTVDSIMSCLGALHCTAW